MFLTIYREQRGLKSIQPQVDQRAQQIIAVNSQLHGCHLVTVTINGVPFPEVILAVVIIGKD